jgi:hypothetical protein
MGLKYYNTSSAEVGIGLQHHPHWAIAKKILLHWLMLKNLLGVTVSANSLNIYSTVSQHCINFFFFENTKNR